MLLNVLFLDIDGVLNPDGSEHPHVFATACVRQLRRILDASPQTHVVFSTTWRYGLSFFELGWLWRHHDLPLDRVLGRTPEIQSDRRGEEIHQWLESAPRRSSDNQVHRCAVLDDEPDLIRGHIPAGSVFACDPWHGLTEEVADRVLRHFASTPAVSPSAKPPKTDVFPNKFSL
jgi:hypothetical protein